MDAVTRISYYFPHCSLTSFWILSNLIINNGDTCNSQTKSLVIAVLVLFCILVIAASFTDTYTASNEQQYVVLLMPLYGPLCFSLPSDFDKDRVYEHYYLKVRDYVHAFISMLAFLLIALFISPISMCLYPNNNANPDPNAPLGGMTSSLDSSIVRTVPVVVALVTCLIMMCLGPPRQMLGFQNVEETCPHIDKQMGDNPIYSGPPGPGSHMSFQGDPEEYDGMPPPNYSVKRTSHNPAFRTTSLPDKPGSIRSSQGLQRGPDSGHPNRSPRTSTPSGSIAMQNSMASQQGHFAHQGEAPSTLEGRRDEPY